MAYNIQQKIAAVIIALTCLLESTHQQTDTACAGVADGNFVRNSASCRSYYLCSEGKPYPNSCPSNLYFNPAQQICDIQERVDCTQCSPFGIQQIPHPYDCAKYYLCVYGIRTMRICGSGLFFDPKIGDCNLEKLVSCTSTADVMQVCLPFTSYGFVVIGDRTDCSRYYFCLNGLAYPEKCAPNLYFNPEKGYCDLPAVYNYCQGAGDIVIPPAYTTTTTSTTTTTTTTTKSSNSTSDASGSTTASSGNGSATTTTAASETTTKRGRLAV